jgi:hypothetical protein
MAIWLAKGGFVTGAIRFLGTQSPHVAKLVDALFKLN